MLTIQRVHADFKFAYNKIDSNHKKDFPIAFIDDVCNIALNKYVNMFYPTNRVLNIKGFEATQNRTDMLAQLEKSQKYTLSTSINEGEFKVYEIDFEGLAHPYAHLTRAFHEAECGTKEILTNLSLGQTQTTTVPDLRIWNVDMIQDDDLNIVLRDPYKKPSTKWERLIGGIGSTTSSTTSTSLYVYSEDTINNITINYLKKPNKVFFGGYDTLEFSNGDTAAPNTSSQPIHPEIPELYSDILIKLMVQEVSGNLGDINQYNLRQNQIVSTV